MVTDYDFDLWSVIGLLVIDLIYYCVTIYSWVQNGKNSIEVSPDGTPEI